MRLELHIDRAITDERIEVYAQEHNEQVRQIEHLARSGEEMTRIIGSSGSEHTPLPLETVSLFFTKQKRVWARTTRGEYQVKQRLFELEERLNPSNFIRISQSEIVNVNAIAGFDLSITGSITLKLKDGHKTYVSRRSLAKFKRQLGL